MSKITRYTGDLKAFASSQLTNERTTFGNVDISDDITENITSAYLRGWGIVGASDEPSLQDFSAAQFTATQILSYLHQMGIPEWDSLQEYPTAGSVCIHDGKIAISTQDANTGNEPSITSLYWVYSGSSKLTVMESSGTFTQTLGAKAFRVKGVGGGAAGGGVDGQGTGTGAVGGGGESGSYFEKIVTDLEASYSIIIGAGGVGSSASDGTSGGETSFIGDETAATSLVAQGGIYGSNATATSGNVNGIGGTGAVATGGDININGRHGGTGRTIDGNTISTGHGGASPLGSGTRQSPNNGNGTGASDYGSGGAGAVVAGLTTNYAGGDGYQGVIIIEEFF